MISRLAPADRRLYVLLCANFVVLGVSMTVYGAAMPQIIAGFGWSYVETGLVLAAGSLGNLLGTFLCGPLLRRLPVRAVLGGGLLLTSLGLALMVRSPLFWVNALLNVGVGIGQGCTEVVTNSVVIRYERPGESRLMNLMHAFFCVGAVVGPLVVGFLALTGIAFPQAFLAAAGIQALAALLLVAHRFPDLSGEHDPGTELGEAADPAGSAIPAPASADAPAAPGMAFLLRQPLLLVAALSLFLYVGVELAMSNWIAEYFVKFRGSAAAQAALMVSVYWGGLLAGRLALAFAGRGWPQERVLAILTAASVLGFGAVVLWPDPIGAVAAAAVTGLCFSGVYPIVMSLVGVWFKGSASAVGVCAAAGSCGVLLFPLGVGALAQFAGLDRALLAAVGFDLALALIAFGLFLRGRRRPAV